MGNKGRKVVVFLVLFCFIFGPRLETLDLLLFTSVILFILGIIIVFKNKKINKELFILLSIVSCSLLYTLIVFSIYNYQDTTIVELNLKYYLYILSSYFIVYIYLNLYKDNYDIKLNSHIFIIGVLNAIFVLFVFLFDGLREQMLEILNYREGERRISGERSFDISMGGSALGSIVFSIIFIQGLFLKKYINNTIINLGLVIILIATTLLARTGLIIIIASLFLYIMYNTVVKQNLWRVSTAKFKGIVATILIIVLSVTIMDQFTPENSIDRFQNTVIPWAFEFYYSFVEEGDFSTHSTDIIFNNMYFLPEKSSEFIFGTSNMGRNDNLPYIPSDVGYIRIIFAVGIIGLVLIFIPHIYLLYLGVKFRETSLSSRLLIISIIIIFITNFKELVFLPRGGASIMFILFMSTIISARNIGNGKKVLKN